MSVMAETGSGSGGLPPLVLVTGDEQLLVDRAIARATAAARRADPGAERRDGTAAGLTAGEFSDLVAPSLFAEPRVVVIRGAQEASKELAAALIGYCRRPGRGGRGWWSSTPAGPGTRRIGEALTKAGATVVACNKITRPAERIDFVRAEIRRAGGTTSPGRGDRARRRGGLGPAGAGLGRRPTGRRHRRHGRREGGAPLPPGPRRGHRIHRRPTPAMAGDLPAALESLRWAWGSAWRRC